MKAIVTGLLMGIALLAAGQAAYSDAPLPSAEEAQRAEFRKQLRELGWIHGPRHVELFSNSALEIPAGYMFLDPADTAKLQALTHNLGGGTQYFLAPEDLHWSAYFRFSDDGYVKDDEQIDAAALLKSIRDNSEEGNKIRREKGWDELTVTGWQTPPHYDAQTKHLEWAIAGRDVKSGEDIVNFNTRLLGRGGVMSVVLLAEPTALPTSIAELKTALTGFDYVAGQRYAEYKPGDKIAKYGLAALITGGAAAIAVKTGFWKVALGALAAGWKLIVAAVVALFAGIRNFFKRKTT